MNRLARDESGFTLIELMVAIALSSVVLLALMNLMDASGRAGAKVVDKAETTQRARMGMDRVVRALRTQACATQDTPPIITGYDSDVTFYSDTNTTTTFAPRKVELYYSGGSIVQKTWLPQSTSPPWTYNGTSDTTTVLASNVALVPGTPLFTYYGWRAPSTPLTTGLSTDTSTASAPANSISQVVNVGISFTANAVSGRTSPGGTTTQTANVYTRNADFSGASDAGRVWGPQCG